MLKRSSKDVSQIAAEMVHAAEIVQEIVDVMYPGKTILTRSTPVPGAKNAAAAALGRLGGLRGGPARAESLSKARRSEIARKAAAARWSAKAH
jgi:hypothetical protein